MSQPLVLGIHCGHDSGAAIVKGTKIIAAVTEERFTRIKHYGYLPLKSIEYCLHEANADINDLDALAIAQISFPEEFKPILKDFKKMKLTLDIGHANITGKNISLRFIELFGKRIGHIHISDNFGLRDNHLPLGCGRIHFEKIFSALKKTGYNDSMTLEIFSKDTDYLVLSLKKAREIWKKV